MLPGALGFYCLAYMTSAMIFLHRAGRPDLIEIETVYLAVFAAMVAVAGLSVAAIATLWPGVIERIISLPRMALLRIVFGTLGVLLTAFGFLCLTEIPGRIIIKYLSHDELLNPETIAAIILAGTFCAIFGPAIAFTAFLWPRVIERSAALPRSELLYLASIMGTSLAVFLGLALGIGNLAAYDKTLVVVVISALLFVAERRISRRVAALYNVIFNRWLAFAGYIAAGTFFFLLRFPAATWTRYVFTRDFPMFQYTALLDLNILKQGALYGWEPNFSCGYPTFLNLRSIFIPYLPFAWLPPAVAFHAMLYVTYVTMPFLVYWLARQIRAGRDSAVLCGWACVGVMTGFFWHILLWGMTPTFESLPFMLLALGFFARAVRGSRWGVLLSSLSWAAVAYIHFGHFAHVGLVLFAAALLLAAQGRSLGPCWALVRISAVTSLFAAPYLALFWHYRAHVILTNMFSYPDESLLGMLRAFLTTVSRFIPTLIWDYRTFFAARAFPDYAYFSLATTFAFVVLYLLADGERPKRTAAALYAAAVVIAAFSFVPRLQLSFQRMLYMVPPLMALALGFWLGEAKKRGHLTPFYILLVLFVFYARPFWMENSLIGPLPTIAARGDFDSAAVEQIKTLGGNYVLYEDTASLVPYADLNRNFPKLPEEIDVHSEAFLHLVTGKRLFSHPGYNPHPYYDLRWTYIATGTYLGKDLTDYPPSLFRDLFRKWGVEYLALWSRGAKNYFANDPEYEKVLEGKQYTVYHLRESDPRAVVTEAGSAEVVYPDNFTATVTLKGARPGTPVVVRCNYFPEWSAESGGRAVALRKSDGQVAFDAPASDCTVTLSFPRNRPWLLVPVVAFIAAVFLSKRGAL